MHAHRIEVLDRADDHDVVEPVADDLELELVPAAHRLLDEHLADRALAQPPLDVRAQFVLVLREPAAVAAERERRPHDCGRRDPMQLLGARNRLRLRNAETGTLDAPLEELAVLGPVDHRERRADQFDVELVEEARLCELAREIERGLPAHRRQQRIGPLAAENGRDSFEVERLEIRPVGEAGVGHDRRRVRVDDDRAEAVVAQNLERLAAGVVELARLPDHDRPGADDQDRLDVVSTRQGRSPTLREAATRRAVQVLPPGGTGASVPEAPDTRVLRPCRRRARRA